jgi:hypothetical protein
MRDDDLNDLLAPGYWHRQREAELFDDHCRTRWGTMPDGEGGGQWEWGLDGEYRNQFEE